MAILHVDTSGMSLDNFTKDTPIRMSTLLKPTQVALREVSQKTEDALEIVTLTDNDAARAITRYCIGILWCLDKIRKVCDSADDEQALRDQEMQYRVGNHEGDAILVGHGHEVGRALNSSRVCYSESFPVSCEATPFIANQHAC